MTKTKPASDAGLRPMLNEAQILESIPISRVTLWRMVRDGRFPKPTHISPGRVAWFAHEVAAWQLTVDARNPDRRRGRSKGRRRKGQQAAQPK